MDARLSRANLVRKNDPHNWNSYEHYRAIHEKRLAEHPFVDESQTNTIEFTFQEFDGVAFLTIEGRVFCKRGIVLEVWKLLETRRTGRNQVLGVRAVGYLYNAWIPGK